MPKKAAILTAVEVKRLTEPGFYAVGGVAGLNLQVTKTGARSWILRTWIAGKRRDIGLGGYPDTSLKQAREKAQEAKQQVAEGIDPIEERKAARASLEAARASRITFDTAVSKFLKNKREGFKNAKHAAQWESTLATYASPVIGNMQVSDVELAHILRILEPIWQTKTETASRVRGRIEAVLAWATVNGYRTGENPARWKGHLDAVLSKPSQVKKPQHHRAMAIDSIGAFLHDLRQREGMAARCLEFVILTAVRSNEARKATWAEIDLDKRLWSIPAEHMKSGKEHRVPLSDAAIELLESLPVMGDLVFPGPRGRVMSDNTLMAVIKRMEVDCTVHGFRSTFRDWCSERTSYPHEICEMALAHTISNKAEAAYRRGDLLPKRARLMRDWAQFCNTVEQGGDVIPIRMTDTSSAKES